MVPYDQSTRGGVAGARTEQITGRALLERVGEPAGGACNSEQPGTHVRREAERGDECDAGCRALGRLHERE